MYYNTCDYTITSTHVVYYNTCDYTITSTHVIYYNQLDSEQRELQAAEPVKPGPRLVPTSSPLPSPLRTKGWLYGQVTKWSEHFLITPKIDFSLNHPQSLL